MNQLESSFSRVAPPETFSPEKLVDFLKNPAIVRKAVEWSNKNTDQLLKKYGQDVLYLGHFEFAAAHLGEVASSFIRSQRSNDADILKELSKLGEAVAQDPSVVFRLDECQLSSQSREILENDRPLQSVKKKLETLVVRYLQIMYAEQVIRQLAPSLQPYIKQVNERLILGRLKNRPLNGSDYSYLRYDEFHCLDLPIGSRYQENDSFFLEVRAILHELLHAIVHEILDLSDIKQDGSQGVLDIFKDESVLRVILEGISLAFEREYMQFMAEKGSSPSLVQKSKAFLRDHLRAVARDGKRNAYNQGFRLSLQLRRNGWAFNDLPQLLEKLKEECSTYSAQPFFGQMLAGIDKLKVQTVNNFSPDSDTDTDTDTFHPSKYFAYFQKIVRNLKKE